MESRTRESGRYFRLRIAGDDTAGGDGQTWALEVGPTPDGAVRTEGSADPAAALAEALRVTMGRA